MPLQELLDEAGGKVDRLSPAGAVAAAEAGALIVDIRSELARGRDGVVPGAVHVPRTVLEWRVEPGGAWRNPHLGDPGRRLVLLCDHGYSSLLAAATLSDLGHEGVADVAGGFEAWRAAGLPVVRAREPESGSLPGMGGPD